MSSILLLLLLFILLFWTPNDILLGNSVLFSDEAYFAFFQKKKHFHRQVCNPVFLLYSKYTLGLISPFKVLV